MIIKIVFILILYGVYKLMCLTDIGDGDKSIDEIYKKYTKDYCYEKFEKNGTYQASNMLIDSDTFCDSKHIIVIKVFDEKFNIVDSFSYIYDEKYIKKELRKKKLKRCIVV